MDKERVLKALIAAVIISIALLWTPVRAENKKSQPKAAPVVKSTAKPAAKSSVKPAGQNQPSKPAADKSARKADPKTAAGKTAVKPGDKKKGLFVQKAGYKPTRWDAFAKKILFTVPQENQMRTMMEAERVKILEARADAADKILKILKEDQRKKWDALYEKADRQSGLEGNASKRLLLDPGYLETQFKLSPEQKKYLYAVTWDYSRKVDKIRGANLGKINNLLQEDQKIQWDEVLNTRLYEEAKKREKMTKISKVEKAPAEVKE